MLDMIPSNGNRTRGRKAVTGIGMPSPIHQTPISAATASIRLASRSIPSGRGDDRIRKNKQRPRRIIISFLLNIVGGSVIKMKLSPETDKERHEKKGKGQANLANTPSAETMCLFMPSSFGEWPRASATSCGKCKMGMLYPLALRLSISG